MGGGGTPSINMSGAPPQAQPVNFGSLTGQAGASAGQMFQQQMDAMVKNYPRMERLQLGTVQNIAGLLGEDGGPLYQWKETGKGKNKTWEKVQVGDAAPNLFTQRARQALDAALAMRDPMRAEADALSSMGKTWRERSDQSYAESGPTAIEAELRRQAEADLADGRSLNAEQIRASQQAARSAFGARGMAGSLGASAAEILNRDAYASQRESERRNFAGAANDMVTRNTIMRRDQAGQQAALAGGFTGNAAQGYGNIAGIGMQGSQLATQIDPMQRALGPGIGMAQGTMNNMGQMASTTYGNALTAASNVAGFNANMLDSQRSNWMNNQAAMAGLRAQTGAANQAGWMGLVGSGIGALGTIGGAMIPSDKRLKENIKPLGKLGGILNLKAYSYDYKDGEKGKVGFMAQDVKKVLPEAVAEGVYNGKKRLFIKPGVLGEALAQKLAA
jgi:hypothetical protein